MGSPVLSAVRRVLLGSVFLAAGMLTFGSSAGPHLGFGLQALQSGFLDQQQRLAEERWLLERLDHPRPDLGAFQGIGELKSFSGGSELRRPRLEAMKARLAQVESPIPLELTAAEVNLLRLLLVSRPQVSARLLAVQELYRPQVEEAVKEQDLPEVLGFLPWAASAWNPAFAAADGRAGLWALDAPTARLYGLRVDHRVDQRRHLLLSSRAAAQRLHDLHQRFEDWRLTLAAFADGPAAVETALLKAGEGAAFEKVRRHLPTAGRSLIAAFTGGAYLSLFAQDEDLSPARMGLPEAMDWVDLQQEADLEALARSLELSPQLLRAWNPHVMGDRLVPDGGNELWLDARVTESAYRQMAQMPALRPQPPSSPPPVARLSQALAYDDLETTTLYVVRRGDSLGRIANLYDVGVSELRAWNGLRGNLIHPGQELLVRAPAPPQRAWSQAAPDASDSLLHQVRRGDTLSTIARHYRVSVGQLQRWNGLDGTLIYAGQSLRVSAPGQGWTQEPAGSAAATQSGLGSSARSPSQRSSRSDFYTVRSGDTLWAIAQRTGLSVRRLERLNPQVRPRDLRPGMRLRLQEASPD
ncbi:MAG TPA: LysM peptidoglycan-binding domain-containing protein [Acidobacteriota bacterium]|nr:LysM peptidoglycan-binding domain-containing protein [Acidobacteriota bacterium]